jgi:predicted  nucleic acid-binding Zn-ribbon protein
MVERLNRQQLQAYLDKDIREFVVATQPDALKTIETIGTQLTNSNAQLAQQLLDAHPQLAQLRAQLAAISKQHSQLVAKYKSMNSQVQYADQSGAVLDKIKVMASQIDEECEQYSQQFLNQSTISPEEFVSKYRLIRSQYHRLTNTIEHQTA